MIERSSRARKRLIEHETNPSSLTLSFAPVVRARRGAEFEKVILKLYFQKEHLRYGEITSQKAFVTIQAELI